MRSLRRTAVILLVAALLVVGTRVVARPYVGATSLIVRIAGLERQHPTIASLETQRFTERRDSVPSRFGPLRAKIYTPADGGRRAVLLTPGVNALGIDEPRLVGLARNLAQSGLLVVTPELPDLSRYLVTPRSTDMIEDAAVWLSKREDLTRGKKIGFMGISFAGGLSTVAAGRPSLRGRLAFVFSFGGHANFQRVVRYLCSAGEKPAPAGYNLPPTPPPHDYGLAILTLDLVARLVPPEQVQPLHDGIMTFLHASHLALFDQAGATREFKSAVAQEAALPEPAKTYLHLVNTRQVKVLGPKILPDVRQLGDDPALSPDESPAPDAPVFLIHGTEDNVVPAAETALLAEHLKGRVKTRVLLTPLITHAEVDRPATAWEVVALVRFWKDMLWS
jgi:dienelactone hydrolase